MKIWLKVGVAALSLSAFCAWASGSSTLNERIAPVGKSCMAGDDCAVAIKTAAASGKARSGDDVYHTKCATCHATGAAGAPKLGDVAAWAPRVEKGMAILHDNAMDGVGGMPAKGLCFDCSDEEIKASVDYMVEKSK